MTDFNDDEEEEEENDYFNDGDTKLF